MGGGSGSFLGLALEAVAEPPAFVPGVDDVGAVGEPVDDGFGEAGVWEDLGPFAEGEVGRDDQAAAFVAFGEDLEDEFGGAVGQGEIAEFIKQDELGAGVASDDAGELAVALGFLEFVGEGGEGGEADAPSLLAGADRERGREVGLAGAARVGVVLLMLLIRCRRGFGWWRRRGNCGVLSSRCAAGRRRPGRARSRLSVV